MKRIKQVLLHLFLLTSLLVPAAASAAGTVPTGDLMPQAYTPNAGCMNIDNIHKDVAIRLIKDGEPMSEWISSEILDVDAEKYGLIINPISEGTYAVEVCFLNQLEHEMDTPDATAFAPWGNGAAEAFIAEPPVSPSGNTIDLSAAVSADGNTPLVYLAADEGVAAYNHMRLLDSVYYGVPMGELRPTDCHYYSLGETYENGSTIWYRIDCSEPLHLITGKKTDTALSHWNKITEYTVILDHVNTTGTLNFGPSETEFLLQGDISVGGLFCGDEGDSVLLSGDPSDGDDSLSVTYEGIRSYGSHITIQDLSALSVYSTETDAIFLSGDGNIGALTIENISGDVSISSDGYANSAIAAFSSDVILQKIDGDLTLLSEGAGMGIEADGDVLLSDISGHTYIYSAEDCCICTRSDLTLHNLGSLQVSTNGTTETSLCTEGPAALHANGDILLQQIGSVEITSTSYPIYAQERPDADGDVTLSHIGTLQIDGQYPTTADGNVIREAIGIAPVTEEPMSFFEKLLAFLADLFSFLG